MTRSALSVEEVVEYCRVQARLLFGSVERMAEGADDLLDDIDEEMAALQSHLERTNEATDGPPGPESTDGPGRGGVDVDAVAERESSLERRQALVGATETRIRLYQDLAGGYTSLAEDLQSDVTDPAEALDRVVGFEVDADAPQYFDDRETLAEVVATRAADDA